jgi:hypothetical protein
MIHTIQTSPHRFGHRHRLKQHWYSSRCRCLRCCHQRGLLQVSVKYQQPCLLYGWQVLLHYCWREFGCGSGHISNAGCDFARPA